MHITVRLGELLWRRAGAREVSLELSEGATVADLLSLLGECYPTLQDYLADYETPPTVILADELAELDTPLTDGATAMLLLAIAGG